MYKRQLVEAAARPERFGTKFNTAVNGFYKSLDDTFKLSLIHI